MINSQKFNCTAGQRYRRVRTTRTSRTSRVSRVSGSELSEDTIVLALGLGLVSLPVLQQSLLLQPYLQFCPPYSRSHL
jgi:hypothetical protein